MSILHSRPWTTPLSAAPGRSLWNIITWGHPQGVARLPIQDRTLPPSLLEGLALGTSITSVPIIRLCILLGVVDMLYLSIQGSLTTLCLTLKGLTW